MNAFRRDVRRQSRLFTISSPKRHLRQLEFERNTAALEKLLRSRRLQEHEKVGLCLAR